jgi:hypothetical protein
MHSNAYSASEFPGPAEGLTTREMSASIDVQEREIIRLRRQVA